MSDSPFRCPSCSGTLPVPRPAACPWCGSATPAAAAPAGRPTTGTSGSSTGGGYGDARDLPRELPPIVTPARGSGGCLVVALVFAIVVAGAVLFLRAR